jgi:hypothetical protein
MNATGLLSIRGGGGGIKNINKIVPTRRIDMIVRLGISNFFFGGSIHIGSTLNILFFLQSFFYLCN